MHKVVNAKRIIVKKNIVNVIKKELIAIQTVNVLIALIKFAMINA